MTRTEFGVPRSQCACEGCVTNCRFMPGFLIPADLGRMIPAGAEPFTWAESNLLASPGAVVVKDGRVFRVHTLVPAVQADGSCIHLTGGRCGIHETAPFGCAFFSCGPEVPGMSENGVIAVMRAGPGSLYQRLWAHLDAAGKRQAGPDVLRKRMAEAWRASGGAGGRVAGYGK